MTVARRCSATASNPPGQGQARMRALESPARNPCACEAGKTMRRPDAGYRCYADLAMAQVEGSDFNVCVQRRPESAVAILAPHGGAIEAGTSEIARAVAGVEFNLYLFEGLRESGNYPALHLTSHRFDEPRCLGLLSGCDQVIAIHGCRGEAPQALLGGLDRTLTSQIGAAIAANGIE